MDEGLSWEVATLPLPAMRHFVLAKEPWNGLYYSLLKIWIDVFGASELSMRMPSVIAGVATILVIYTLGKKLFGARSGLVAALLFAVSPMAVFFAHEARVFTLEWMLVAVALLFFLRVVEKPSVGNLAGWIVASALAAYAHPLAATAVPAQLLSLVMFERRRVPWWHLLAGAAIVGLLVVPLLWLVRREANQLASWIPGLSWDSLGRSVYGMFNGLWADGFWTDASGQMVVTAYALGALVGIIAFVRAWDQSRAAAMPFVLTSLSVIVPFGLVAAYSVLRPSLSYRYMLFTLPALCLFVGGGIGTARSRAVQILTLAALLTGSVWHSWVISQPTWRADWRKPASLILARAHPGDAVGVRWNVWRNNLNYYFIRMHMQPGLVEWAYPEGLFIDGQYPDDADSMEFAANHLLSQIDATAASGRRLWFVFAGEGMGLFERWASVEAIKERMHRDYGRVDEGYLPDFDVFLCSQPHTGPQH
ncbi:MAG: glycosyltransferase family 39 protein [Candidatus Binatus sp.]